jgi:hypothetical protein
MTEQEQPRIRLADVPGAPRDRWLDVPRVKAADVAGFPVTLVGAAHFEGPHGPRVKLVIRSPKTGELRAIWLPVNANRLAIVTHFASGGAEVGPVRLVQRQTTKGAAWIVEDVEG